MIGEEVDDSLLTDYYKYHQKGQGRVQLCHIALRRKSKSKQSLVDLRLAHMECLCIMQTLYKRWIIFLRT